MYPHRQLRALAEAKAALQSRITLRRAECTVLARRVVRPLAWLDRARCLWRKLAPYAGLAALPAGAIAGRALFPRFRLGRLVLAWSPAILRAVLAFTANRVARKQEDGSAASSATNGSSLVA